MYVCVCVSVCMYVCMYVYMYMYVCMYVCMYVYIYMYTVLPRFTAPLYNATPAYRHRLTQYNSISVYFCDMLFYRKHSVAWCFLNNQPTWACLVTCIHYILDFGVVKSKLNLHLYITGSFFIQLYILSCFIHSCYESCKLLNFRFCHKRLNKSERFSSYGVTPPPPLTPLPAVRQPPHVSGVQK